MNGLEVGGTNNDDIANSEHLVLDSGLIVDQGFLDVLGTAQPRGSLRGWMRGGLISNVLLTIEMSPFRVGRGRSGSGLTLYFSINRYRSLRASAEAGTES